MIRTLTSYTYKLGFIKDGNLELHSVISLAHHMTQAELKVLSEKAGVKLLVVSESEKTCKYEMDDELFMQEAIVIEEDVEKVTRTKKEKE